MTRFFDRQNSFQLVFFFLNANLFLRFFVDQKRYVYACVAVMYVRLFEHLLFQLTVHTKILNIQAKDS